MRRIFIFVLVVTLLLMLLNCKSKHNGDCDAYGYKDDKNMRSDYGERDSTIS
jgi:hypothetical protein